MDAALFLKLCQRFKDLVETGPDVDLATFDPEAPAEARWGEDFSIGPAGQLLRKATSYEGIISITG